MRPIMWVTALLVVGCGVSDSTRISELSEEDVESFCDDISDGARDVTCTFDETTITFQVNPSYEECVTTFDPTYYAGCEVTAGDVRACYDAYAELSDREYCDLGTDYPEVCGPLYDCILSN